MGAERDEIRQTVRQVLLLERLVACMVRSHRCQAVENRSHRCQAVEDVSVRVHRLATVATSHLLRTNNRTCWHRCEEKYVVARWQN